jgi:hypothetical protein
LSRRRDDKKKNGGEQMGNSRKLVLYALIGAGLLAGCGKDSDKEGQDKTTGSEATTTPAAAAQVEPGSSECGKGGNQCPAGLECLTWQDGHQACGPLAVPAVVLIKDGTLGGSCLQHTDKDLYPGASIASVEMIGVDGKRKGYGRLAWDKAGFETAADRGTPPDGKAPPADACTGSYNLGCDGQAVFEIIDDGGAVRPLREGEKLIAHLRGEKTCGEITADEIEAAICTDPAAATSGNLSSCTSKVRIVEANSDLYGPDRVGGTLRTLSPK